MMKDTYGYPHPRCEQPLMELEHLVVHLITKYAWYTIVLMLLAHAHRRFFLLKENTRLFFGHNRNTPLFHAFLCKRVSNYLLYPLVTEFLFFLSIIMQSL
jgi:hypothetical protein